MQNYIDDQYDSDAALEDGNFSDCLDAAEDAFEASWEDTNTVPDSGVSPDITASFNECF